MRIKNVFVAFALLLTTSIAVESVVLAESYKSSPAKAAASAKKKLKQSIKKYGLAKLPSASKLVAKKKKKTAKALAYNFAAASSATPPTLLSISQSPIKDIFWAPNIVDEIVGGSPSQASCSQFYAGTQTGDSGGIGACHMAESVGFSFASILESQSSLCYMKNFPTQGNLNSGGVSVVSGELPSGGITKLFAPPTGSSARTVKVNVTGAPGGGGEGEGGGGPETIYIKVYSQTENQASSNMYKADLWFCASGTATGYDRLTIKNSGQFLSENAGSDGGGNHALQVGGFLTSNGNNLIWDTSKTRSSVLKSEHDGGYFLSDITILPSNIIKIKNKDDFGGGSRKGYVQTSFSGSDIEGLRFLRGAFIENFGGGPDSGFAGATKYGDGYYQHDSASPFEDDVLSIDFDADSFYSQSAPDAPDVSGLDCSPTVEVEINMDMNNSSVMASVQECDIRDLQHMHFCHDDPEVAQADQNFASVCHGS